MARTPSDGLLTPQGVRRLVTRIQKLRPETRDVLLEALQLHLEGDPDAARERVEAARQDLYGVSTMPLTWDCVTDAEHLIERTRR